MRFFSLFLSILLLGSVLNAGTNPVKRYLVGPNSEVIPLSADEIASATVKKRTERTTSSSVCPDKFTFGYPPDIYTVNSNFGAYHRDVLGEWFVAPASGTIDTLFWFNRAAIGAYDSTIYLRVHSSNIGPTYGPGVRPGPFNPPCQNWGYWVNSNDCDQGVAAFIEEATVTGHPWVSTINGSPVPSGPPFGAELWGFGGFPKQVHPNTQENVPLADLAVLNVTQGQKFFISMRVADGGGPLCGHLTQGTQEARTEWNASGFTVGTNDPDYPSRNWKFYEHDKGPSNCAGFPIDSIQRGWVARGGFGADSLTVASYNFWYVMSVTSNVPPIISDVDQVHTTFATTPWTVQATIIDCDPSNPGNAGVATAVLRWNKNGVSQPDIPMSLVGTDTYEGTLPGNPVNTNITYKVVATDAQALVGQSAAISYSVVELGNEWYAVDTNAVCAPHDLSDGGGTLINPTAFFNPTNTGSGTAPKDDGTAGPFDMGGNFTVFGDTFRYAWVGVNGAIGLTKTALDTNDVNANGFATSAWTFPYSVVRHGRADTVNLTGMPRMFIAPFWADHIVAQDSPLATFGHIRYGNDGDPNLFIAEWDSVGTFDTNGSTADITTFRVILNKADGTIQFQYKSCGLNGLDSAATVGMQYDTSSAAHPGAFVFLNNQTYPYETKPRDNYCVKFKPTVGASVADGWNMVSVSGTPADANYAKTHLFPEATSAAFSYGAGYVTQTTLANGPGYWMKFTGGSRVGSIPATWLPSLVLSVQDKWNMIGSVSGYALTSAIVPGGGTAVVSPYYAYHGGYQTTTALTPGEAFWVKVNGAGTLSLTAAAMAPKAQPTAAEIGLGDMNTVTVRDAAGQTQTLYFGDASRLKTDASYYEMPPAPPVGGFDVRFTSNQMVEAYTSTSDKAAEYPIAIKSAVYPVTISWTLNGAEGRSFEVAAGAKNTPMVGTGSKVISDASVKTVVIRMTANDVPKTFALSQNYPNPFNPSTHFRVDVAKTSQVEVSVYDVLGRKIVTLLNGEKASGSYTMEWNGLDAQGITVPTGMYLIRMNAGEFSATQKVMLMK
jgi:hypothetical protein